MMTVLLLAILAQLAAANSLGYDGGRSLKFIDSYPFIAPEGVNVSTFNNALLDGTAISGAADASGASNINGGDLNGFFEFKPVALRNTVIGGGGSATSGTGAPVGAVRDFLRIETVSEDNVAQAGNGTASNGVNIGVNLVDSATLGVKAESGGNVANATNGNALNGNRISVLFATPDSNIGISSKTDGNVAITQPGDPKIQTAGSIIAIGNTEYGAQLGEGSLFIETDDQNNVAKGPGTAFSGPLVQLGNVDTEGPVSIKTNSKNNVAEGTQGTSNSGGIILLGDIN